MTKTSYHINGPECVLDFNLFWHTSPSLHIEFLKSCVRTASANRICRQLLSTPLAFFFCWQQLWTPEFLMSLFLVSVDRQSVTWFLNGLPCSCRGGIHHLVCSIALKCRIYQVFIKCCSGLRRYLKWGDTLISSCPFTLTPQRTSHRKQNWGSLPLQKKL